MKKIICPFCFNTADNIEDKEIEAHGMYVFNCQCGETFVSPKNDFDLQNSYYQLQITDC